MWTIRGRDAIRASNFHRPIYTPLCSFTPSYMQGDHLYWPRKQIMKCWGREENNYRKSHLVELKGSSCLELPWYLFFDTVLTRAHIPSNTNSES